jgi:hypothetical protein
VSKERLCERGAVPKSPCRLRVETAIDKSNVLGVEISSEVADLAPLNPTQAPHVVGVIAQIRDWYFAAKRTKQKNADTEDVTECGRNSGVGLEVLWAREARCPRLSGDRQIAAELVASVARVEDHV